MLQALFSSKTRIKLLKLFLTNPANKYYLREISKLSQEPLTPIRRELLNLKKVGLLKRKKTANLTYYFLNPEFLLCNELRSMIKKAYGITEKAAIKKQKKKEIPLIEDENAA
jgi:predicted transcriptional regulator